jgi:hypothetical protein
MWIKDKIDQRISRPNALASQYQRDEIGARGDLRVSYITHETGAAGMHGVFGLGFTEQLPSLVQSKVRPLD